MQVTLILLQSANGILTRSQDDRLKWGGSADKKFFAATTREIGTVIMGSSSFEALGGKPLKDRHTIVMTSNPARYADSKLENLEFSTLSPEALVKELTARGLKRVALIGGSKLNASFLNSKLVTDIHLSIGPVLFSDGIPLVDREIADFQIGLELLDVQNLDGQTITLHYRLDYDRQIE